MTASRLLPDSLSQQCVLLVKKVREIALHLTATAAAAPDASVGTLVFCSKKTKVAVFCVSAYFTACLSTAFSANDNYVSRGKKRRREERQNEREECKKRQKQQAHVNDTLWHCSFFFVPFCVALCSLPPLSCVLVKQTPDEMREELVFFQHVVHNAKRKQKSGTLSCYFERGILSHVFAVCFHHLFC